MASKNVDVTTLNTVWHSLQNTCMEMRHLIDRTAQNYLISQLHDVSVGIWTATGDTVAVPVGLPVQFLGAQFAIKEIVKKFEGNLDPGDIILTNDPYKGATGHLPDWGFFRPIFYKGEFLFMTLVRAHQQDTGGSFPGGYFPNAHDIHAEGVMIPPIKVWSAGKERTDVMELIWNQVRFPHGVRIDNAAMIAATKLAEQRVIALLDKYGKDVVLACIGEMFERTERAVRAEIRMIPDGTYAAEAATDDDGTELDVPVWVRLDLTVKDDQLILDFSRSDAQRKGFVNSIYAGTYGNAIAAVCMTLDPALADYHNEGTQRAITVIAPEGSVVACKYPATVGAAPVNVGNQIMEVVLDALSKARPARAVAAWSKHRGDYVFAVDPRTSERYVRTSFDYDGSGGAVWGNDGFQGLSGLTTLGAVNRSNVEEVETRIPWRIIKWEFLPDLTGAGRWRGGPGVYWEAQHYGRDAAMATGSSDGDEMLGFGALGGEPTPPCRTYIKRGEEMIRIKPHRMVPMIVDDIVVKYSSGGGGVGPAWQRDPEMVRMDVRKGLVSIKAARETYKVVLHPETLEIDRRTTDELRAASAATAGT